jgi:hypothetical protein
MPRKPKLVEAGLSGAAYLSLLPILWRFPTSTSKLVQQLVSARAVKNISISIVCLPLYVGYLKKLRVQVVTSRTWQVGNGSPGFLLFKPLLGNHPSSRPPKRRLYVHRR